MAVEDLKYFKQFDIKFSTLAIGIHEFHLDIKKKYFAKHKNEEIIDANIQVLLELNKKENLCIFNFTIDGQLTLQCDICLDDLAYPIHTEETLILKLSEETTGEYEDENILFVNTNEHIYNIEQVLYEIIYAQIPMRKSHEDVEQECNKNMIKQLELYTSKQTQAIDDRWEVLKNLKI